EKASDERFQSARDLAFALEGLSGSSRTDTLAESPRLETKRPSWERNWKLSALATALLLMALLATLLLRQPTQAATGFVPPTTDSHSKGRLGSPPPVTSSPLFTDGSRLYFTVEASLGTG